MDDRELARRRLATSQTAQPDVGRLLAAREAASSVALSHQPDCKCVVCRAADGDVRALAEVFEALR